MTPLKKTKLDYLWLDGCTPTQIRYKTKVVEDFGGLTEAPIWGFDGSSTEQADGGSSDCVLKPVRVYPNPFEQDAAIVLCEVYGVDGKPHESNTRKLLEDTIPNGIDEWVGFEQEYTLYKDGWPLGWPKDDEPAPQGDCYCGRNIGDRWLLERICEKHKLQVSLHPKPIEGDWNGAGCHTNFSTKEMREDGGYDKIIEACEKLGQNIDEHINSYGIDNDKRLTGLHETCSITEFKYGVSDRGASIRIPWQVERDKKGYLEDRRPASNCDPYLVSQKLVETICK